MDQRKALRVLTIAQLEPGSPSRIPSRRLVIPVAWGVWCLGIVQADIVTSASLVSTMLEGAGFEVTDLGVDVPPRHFAEVAVARKADGGAV